MFIPAPAQDLQLPLTQKLEANPVAPVSAVPGVAEDAQNLDSRVALQWTQPVFAGAEAQAGRSALASPLPEALLQSPKPAVPGYQPQGADPDALQSGDVHPLLAQGLSTWLSGVLAKARANGSTLANSNDILLAAPLAKSPASVSDGASLQSTDLETGSAKTTGVMAQLQNIYQAIAGSDVFAAQRLNEVWMPRQATSKQTQTALASKNAVLEAIQLMAQPVQQPNPKQLTQWVAALEPDSEAAEQAARMLTQGNMAWQTELVPGVPMRIVREDAWRNHPRQAGQLEKGAMLKVEVTLPHLGALRIVGSQWGQDLSLHVSHGSPDNTGHVNWQLLTPKLLEELKLSGITDVKVAPFYEAAPGTDQQDSPNV